MKAIRMFYSRVNWKANSVQRAKCVSSLKHSLRIACDKEDQFQWHNELLDENIIWLKDKYFKLYHFSDEHKQTLLNSIAPPPVIKNKKYHQKNRSRYKSKIKKAISSERAKGNENSARFLGGILSYESNELIPHTKTEEFKKLELTRKKQRINMLDKYIVSHNALTTKLPNENCVYVQEGLFKFPIKWGIDTSIVPKKAYVEVVKSFLEEHFPDYRIDCIVCHHDERELEEDTGAHSHYFLNGQNITTGDYDLHRHQIRVVNEFIKRRGSLFDLLPIDSDLNFQQTKIFGEYFQQMFYAHVNRTLLNPIGFNATFADETEKNSEQRKQMNREAKLPKKLRKYNLSTRANEIALKKLKAFEEKLSNEKQHLSGLNQDISYQQQQLDIKIKQLKEAKELFDYFEEQARLFEDEILVKQQEIQTLSEIKANTSQQLSLKIAEICHQIYLIFTLRSKGLDKKADEYVQRILSAYSKLNNSSLKDICIAAAHELNETSLARQMEATDEAAIDGNMNF